MLSVVSVCLPGAEGVAELAKINKLRRLRFADDELGAAFDLLVFVGKPKRECVA